MIRCIAIMFCLAACAGGPKAGLPEAAPPLGFDALRAQVIAQGPAFAAALPASGTAVYHGKAQLDLPLDLTTPQPYQGDLTVNVTFGGAADPLTGTITGLQGPAGNLAGQLTISDGTLVADARTARDYQFDARLAGTLVQGAQSNDIAARIAGDFYGTSGTAMAGVIYSGVLRQGNENDIFDGAFVAQKQDSGG